MGGLPVALYEVLTVRRNMQTYVQVKMKWRTGPPIRCNGLHGGSGTKTVWLACRESCLERRQAGQCYPALDNALLDV